MVEGTPLSEYAINFGADSYSTSFTSMDNEVLAVFITLLYLIYNIVMYGIWHNCSFLSGMKYG